MGKWILLIFVQMLFAMNFVASKLVLKEMNAFELSFWRFFLSFFPLITFALLSKSRPEIKAPLSKVLAVGFLLTILLVGTGQTLFLKGLSYSSPESASVWATTIPLFGLFFSFFLEKRWPKKRQAIGFFLCFLAILNFQNLESFSMQSEGFLGNLFLSLSCLSMGLGIAVNKRFIDMIDPLWGSLVFFFFGPLLLIPLTNFETPINGVLQGELLVPFLYCVLGATTLTYFLNNLLFKKHPADIIALFIFLQPAFACFFSFLVFGSVITVKMIISFVILSIGLFLALKKT